jgi:signal transduction histidine kinase/ActR/RegA family two-component response regulator
MSIQTKLIFIVGIVLMAVFVVMEYVLFRYAEDKAMGELLKTAESVSRTITSVRQAYLEDYFSREQVLNSKAVRSIHTFMLGELNKNSLTWSSDGILMTSDQEKVSNRWSVPTVDELEAMKYFASGTGKRVHFNSIDEDGRQYLLYTQPLRADKRCLNCHHNQKSAPSYIKEKYSKISLFNEDDLVGVLSIKMPMSLIYEPVWKLFKKTLVIHIVAFCIFYLLIVFISKRYLTKPLRRLITGMENILAGKYGESVGKLSGEFEHAGRMFNEMSRNLDRTTTALISAKKEAEVNLAFKSRFLTQMSHDIRNPLNTIIGTTAILEEEISSEEKRDNLQLLKQSENTLLTIINDILDLAKIEAEGIILKMSMHSIRDLAEVIVESVKERTADKDISVVLNIDLDMPEQLYCDSYYLSKAIKNILNCSETFTVKGEISLNIEKIRESVLITISDSGKGLPSDVQAEILGNTIDTIYDESRTDAASALSVVIAYKLVYIMGGEITFETKRSQGTIFKIQIPFEVAPVINDKISEIKQPIRKERGRKKLYNVLLVDDSEESYHIIKVFLKEVPFQLEYVSNGEEALSTIKKNPDKYDLILMDMQMPVMDGYVATRTLRDWEDSMNREHIGIIALTASVLRENIEKSLKAGCDCHFGKPFEKAELIKVMFAIINGGKCIY